MTPISIISSYAGYIGYTCYDEYIIYFCDSYPLNVNVSIYFLLEFDGCIIDICDDLQDSKKGHWPIETAPSKPHPLHRPTYLN